jgi:hypothetical protein
MITIPLICIVLPLSVVTHEFGHAITGLSLGLNNPSVSVWLGWQIYPELDRSQQVDWPKSGIAQTRFSFYNTHMRIENSLAYQAQDIQFKPTGPVFSVSLSDKENSLVLLMGSGLNWLLSVLALYFLMIFKNNKAMLITCTPFALLYYDLVSYSLLPTFFDLRHWIFWGSNEAEPLLALTQIGVHHNLSVVIIYGIALTQSVLTLKVLNAQITGGNLHNKH